MTTAASSSAPVVFRASKRLVVGRLCIAAAAGMLATGAWLVELTWLTRLLGAVAAVQGVQAVYAWAGRVSLGPDGLHSRGLVFPRRAPWSRLLDCEARTTKFGRHMRVRLLNQKGHIRLPVPSSPYLIPDPAFDDQVDLVRAWWTENSAAAILGRTGSGSPRLYAVLMATVLAVALALDRPWDWSLGGDGPLAASLPDLCQVAPAAVHDIIGDQSGTHWSYPGTGETQYQCDWEGDFEHQQMMLVAVDVFSRLGPYGATWRAQDALNRFRRNLGGAPRDLPTPIGDESAAFTVFSDSYVVARRANVFVEVYSHGAVVFSDGSTPDVVPDAAVVARDVADRIGLQSAG